MMDSADKPALTSAQQYQDNSDKSDEIPYQILYVSFYIKNNLVYTIAMVG